MSDALRVRERWYSPRVQTDITVVRWGVLGVPVLVFPTAGGDAEEIERQGLVNACGPLLAEGRVKLYSVDSVAGRAMVAKDGSAEHRMWLLSQFQECVRWEVVPAIHAGLDGAHLDRLRQRRVILASGEGAWEDIGSSWQMASVLGDKGIPNRVDNWGPQWPHEWHTWREMLPQYLRELT